MTHNQRMLIPIVIAVLVSGLFLSAFGSDAVEQTVRERTARLRANYDCPPAEGPREILALASELSVHRYDKNKLACSADLLFSAAQAMPHEVSLLPDAISVHLVYLAEIGKLKLVDSAHLYDEEWLARTKHAGDQALALVASLEQIAPKDPGTLMFKSLTIVLASQGGDPVNSVQSAKEAIVLLEQAIAENENVGEGLALMALGRLFYELPTMFGGNSEKSIPLFQRALKLRPQDIQLHRYLAESYEQMRRSNEALDTLNAALSIRDPAFAKLQATVDELDHIAGLALRLQDAQLSKKLSIKRQRFFEKYPMLNTREMPEARGQSSRNPISAAGNTH